ncbi:MAG: DEAD/DEAH box helicase [Candidatus Omnitrophica bacterium]|nr:DEAD/DEAH box helicase [Candidatus Omnitrophota bacterium]
MIYDDFQKQAIAHIDKDETIIVSAPTGAGKTVIAEYAIEKTMSSGKSAIYTAPIKALSNQKYRDFRARYGEEKVGILTGDVSINTHAPILIMTTEIYRNTLFENINRVKHVAWVVFDEVHYLDDVERGTVWEESIMFSPSHINFVCLSATVPNITELAQWIESIHNRPIRVIIEAKRPVPLEHRFQCQGHIVRSSKALSTQGFLHCDDWHHEYRHRRGRRHFPKIKPNRLAALVSHIQDAKELPCIFFVFSRHRAKCLAEEMMSFNFLAIEEEENTRALFWDLCEKYNLTEERSARELFDLVRRGIAYHHAGMLPTLKEVVEQLFTHRALKLIFTTETFALGINMPARSVVFDELRKFYGTHFGNLRTRDYYQMAGRAGRRGMDECGFVYSRINPRYISYHEVQKIIYGKSEEVTSQFNATYATVLNLYKQFGRNLLSVYPRSFHFFQSSKKRRRVGYNLLERKLKLLEEMEYMTEETVTPKGEFASSLYGYELALSEMHADGFLDTLNETELSIILIGLIFEPRKGDYIPSYSKQIQQLIRHTESYIRRIHSKEHKHTIRPYSKSCHFNLAPALEAWLKGKKFSDIIEIASVDEGEIVRYFRMVIQLLRQICSAHGAQQHLKETAHHALNLINKDIIDAEKQLRV